MYFKILISATHSFSNFSRVTQIKDSVNGIFICPIYILLLLVGRPLVIILRLVKAVMSCNTPDLKYNLDKSKCSGAIDSESNAVLFADFKNVISEINRCMEGRQF